MPPGMSCDSSGEHARRGSRQLQPLPKQGLQPPPCASGRGCASTTDWPGSDQTTLRVGRRKRCTRRLAVDLIITIRDVAELGIRADIALDAKEALKCVDPIPPNIAVNAAATHRPVLRMLSIDRSTVAGKGDDCATQLSPKVHIHPAAVVRAVAIQSAPNECNSTESSGNASSPLSRVVGYRALGNGREEFVVVADGDTTAAPGRILRDDAPLEGGYSIAIEVDASSVGAGS